MVRKMAFCGFPVSHAGPWRESRYGCVRGCKCGSDHAIAIDIEGVHGYETILFLIMVSSYSPTHSIHRMMPISHNDGFGINK